ncbi:hypothetical protein [Methanocrinis sp.]|uniref:hypothetical protein n=1 Tax=Methanocrinis sp. TaxID=3101522 RepID=UPI003D0EA109
MIDPDRFLVVSYSIRDQLNVSDFDFRDFFVSMALMIYDRAEVDGVKLNRDIEEDFKDFVKRITKVEEDEVTRSRAAGISLTLAKVLLLIAGSRGEDPGIRPKRAGDADQRPHPEAQLAYRRRRG